MNPITEQVLGPTINATLAQAKAIHVKQLLKRLNVIKELASVNNHGDVNIMGATMSHIADMCQQAINDFTTKED